MTLNEGDCKMENERGRITAEQALLMLKKEKINLTLDQVSRVLEFMRKLAAITVSNYLSEKNEKDSRFICESEYGRASGQRILTKKSGGGIEKILSNK